MSSFRNYGMTPERQRLIDETKAAIDRVIANEDAGSLRSIVEMTLWLPNCRDFTWAELEIALGAILSVMSMSHLRDMHAHAVACIAKRQAHESAERAA